MEEERSHELRSVTLLVDTPRFFSSEIRITIDLRPIGHVSPYARAAQASQPGAARPEQYAHSRPSERSDQKKRNTAITLLFIISNLFSLVQGWTGCGLLAQIRVLMYQHLSR